MMMIIIILIVIIIIIIVHSPKRLFRTSTNNRFQVAMRLFRFGKNKKVVHKAQLSMSLMFLPHFDVLCDLLLNRRTDNKIKN